MQKQWVRRSIATVTVIGAAAAIAATLGTTGADGPTGPHVLPVSTVAIEPVTSYRTHRTYTGSVVAARATDLSWERAGEIVAISVDQGDRVEAGAVLAILNTRSLQARRRELLARRAAAQALLDELNAGARPETIAAARADVRNLESRLKLEQLVLARRQTLIDQRAVSQADYDQATFGLQSAEAMLDVAQHKLAELEAGPRVEQKVAQAAAVEQLDAAIEAADVDLEESQLVAPFSGTITGRVMDEGAVVAPGQVVLRLIEDSKLEAWFGVPVSAARQVQAKAQYTVRVDQQTLVARVQAVLPELDTVTRTRRVVLALQHDASAPVFPGEIARLDLEHEVATPASFWLPTTALVRGSRGLWSCFAAVADPAANGESQVIIEKRDVKIAHTAGEEVLVRGMLQAGDRVVAEGAHRVVPGQAVRVTSAL